jgi:hypothetical protein
MRHTVPLRTLLFSRAGRPNPRSLSGCMTYLEQTPVEKAEYERHAGFEE